MSRLNLDCKPKTLADAVLAVRAFKSFEATDKLNVEALWFNEKGYVYAQHPRDSKLKSIFGSPVLYAVYSYGNHFPMYVYDNDTGQWFGNTGKYSPTTTKHQTMFRPRCDYLDMDTEQLLSLIDAGGYKKYVVNRMNPNQLIVRVK